MPAQTLCIRIPHMIDPTLHRRVKLRERDPPGAVFLPALAQPPRIPNHIAGLHPPVVGIHHKPQPGDAAAHRQHLSRFRMDREPQPRQPGDDRLLPRPEFGLAVTEQRKIVHVAQKRATAQFARHEPIKTVEIDVAPELARQVADGQAAWTAGRRAVIARKPHHIVFIRQHTRPTRQNAIHQPQHVILPDDTGQRTAQHRMIQAGEVLHNIAAQHVAVALGISLEPFHRRVGSLPNAVGVALRVKAGLKRRFYDVAQRMMHHPIAEWRRADFAQFGFVNDEMGIGAGGVVEGLQVVLERQEPVR